MKITLMNKNTEVLIAEYNEQLAVFTKIYEIKNIDYAPVIINQTLKTNHNDSPSKCPECGAQLRFEGGCDVCPECGYSHCG